jgi:hypothetical protein
MVGCLLEPIATVKRLMITHFELSCCNYFSLHRGSKVEAAVYQGNRERSGLGRFSSASAGRSIASQIGANQGLANRL